VDPGTYTAVCVVLVLAASVAAYVPARRATRIDPVDALRADG
jgi:ABC-type lipoprotein release transport system permease subunit